MSTGPRLNQDQVEAKVTSLRASGFSPEQLRRACLAVLDAHLPLRDAIVLREAKRLAELETPESREAWAQILPLLKRSVPASTFALWLEPCSPFGAEGETLILAAPDTIRSWTARRYSSLIEEALRSCSDFTRVSFAAPECLGVAA